MSAQAPKKRKADDNIVLLAPNMPDPPPKYLHCPICMEFFGSRIIYQCNEGHVICINCLYRVKSTTPDRIKLCPTCRIQFKDNRSRNRVLEYISKQHPFKCHFRNCNIVLPYGDIEIHEMKCDYAYNTCGVDECDWQGHHHEIEAHCTEKHAHLFHRMDADASDFRFHKMGDLKGRGTYALLCMGKVYFLEWDAKDETISFMFSSFVNEPKKFQLKVVDEYDDTTYSIHSTTESYESYDSKQFLLPVDGVNYDSSYIEVSFL